MVGLGAYKNGFSLPRFQAVHNNFFKFYLPNYWICLINLFSQNPCEIDVFDSLLSINLHENLVVRYCVLMTH